MSIAATAPSTVNATFDKWAFAFSTQGDGLAEFGTSTVPPVKARATLVKYRVRPDGVAERSPLPSDYVEVSIDDLYALAATDPIVATALADLDAAVAHIAGLQGKL